MERYEAKIISLFIIFASILCATLLPIRVSGAISRRGKRGRQVLGGLSCFSGGIFLATYLLDMAPEVRLLLERSLLRPRHIRYPLPEFIIGSGFFFILLVELLVTSIRRRRLAAKARRGKSNEVEVTVDMHTDMNTIEDTKLGVQLRAETQVNSLGTDSSVAEKIDETAIQDEVKSQSNGRPMNGSDTSAIVTDTKEQLRATGYDNQTFAPTEPANGVDKGSELCRDEVKETGAGTEESRDAGHNHTTRSIILVLALSLDSVFEGMAVGLRTTMQGVWSLTIAIVAHEVVIAFGMGMQLMKHQTRRTVIVIAAVYSIMSPVGGAVGTLLMETQGRNTDMDLANGVLQVSE